jgi:hypothetical protein
MSDAPTDVFIPDQIRRQAARAEELRRELAGEDAPATEETSSPTTVVEEQAPEPQQQEPEPQTIQAEPDWQQRYRTLQGKYDTETGHMRGQISSMERLLATMQSPPPAAAPQASPSVPVQFNEADVELYGEDLLEAASRAAEAKLEARYGKTIQNLQQHVQQLSGRQEEDRVFRELDSDPELAGRWRGLNTNPQFIEWLQAVDEMAGVSRNTMLQHAYSNGDAMRTGRFFKKFMAEHTAPPPTAMVPQTAASPARHSNGGYGNGSAAGGLRLEDMAAPGRAAGSGAGNGAPSPRLWSRPDITAFYRARTMGKFKGREAEAEQLEADLLKAGDEGRLV